MRVKEANYKKGKWGEEMAKRYLIDRGYQPIFDNYTNKLGEIDLVMGKDEWLVLVEVKYKSDDVRGRPEEMVNRTKIAQVKRVAQLLIQTEKVAQGYLKYRIDAVCILGKVIRHYINVDE